MTSRDPLRVAHALESVAGELRTWSAYAAETYSEATRAQAQAAEAARRADFAAAQAGDELVHSEQACDAGRREHDNAERTARRAVDNVTAAVTLAQGRLRENQEVERGWQGELGRANGWQQRAWHRTQRAQGWVADATHRLSVAENDLGRARAAYNACRSATRGGACLGQRNAVVRAEQAVHAARVNLQQAQAELNAARHELEAAQRRVGCCQAAVARAQVAVQTAGRAVAAAGEADRAVQLALADLRRAAGYQDGAETALAEQRQAVEEMKTAAKVASTAVDQAAESLRLSGRAYEHGRQHAHAGCRDLDERVDVLRSFDRDSL